MGDTIRYVLAMLRRNSWLITAIIGAALALATIITLLTKPLYTAQTSIQINDQSAQVLGGDADGTATANLDWDIDRFLNTQIGVLRSRALADRVARKLDLSGNSAFYEAMGTTVPEGNLDTRQKRELIIGLLASGFDIELTPNTRIVDASFTSADSDMSALIVNTYASEFIQANLKQRYDSSSYARKFVAEQLEEARERLEASERELNAYAREAGLIRTRTPGSTDSDSEGGSVTSASLMQLNEAANKAQADRVTAQARWNSEKDSPLFSSPSVLGNPSVQGLMSQRANIEQQLQTARSRYLPDHPSVRKLTTELDAVKTQLNKTANEVRNSIRSQYLAAETAEKRLKENVAQLQGDTLAEQDRAVRYNTLAREADTNRSVYDGLLQRFRELNAAAGISSSNIAIVDPADPPMAPSSPNLLLNLALAAGLGIGVAGLAVLLRDQLEDQIRVPEDIEQKINLPVLGVIPTTHNDDPVEALLDPKSPISEAYNSLRGALLYSTTSGLPNLLLVTSAEPAEGKSTTSLAIARSFAMTGKKVLLIDADLRRPSVHRITGKNNSKGLSSVLTAQDSLQNVIVASDHANLHVMPSGPIPASPTELLGSPKMAAILEQMTEAFDLVVIDSSPVLGLADSPVLAALADGVVLVIEAGRAHQRVTKSALRRLRAMSPVILGAVMTKFDPSKSANGYSAYYGYDYYRYSGDEAAG